MRESMSARKRGSCSRKRRGLVDRFYKPALHLLLLAATRRTKLRALSSISPSTARRRRMAAV